MKKNMSKKLWLLAVVVLLAALLAVPALAAEEDGMMSVAIEERDYAQQVEPAYGAALSDYVNITTFRADLLNQISQCKAEIDISSYNLTNTADMRRQIAEFIWYDMPEAFQCGDMSFSYYTSSNKLSHIEIEYDAFADTAAEYAACWRQFKAAADAMLVGVKGNNSLTDVQKALILHDRIAQWTEYDYANLQNGTEPPQVYNAYGVFGEQSAVCQGYTLAYNYLLQQIGIPVDVCLSEKLDHIWNIVWIGGEPYHVDITWDDPVWDVTGRVDHDNFLRSTDGMVATGHYYEVGSQAYIDYESYPDSTTYDNYYWQNSNAAFQLIGNEIYYVDHTTGYIKRESNHSNVRSVAATWKGWSGNYTRLSAYNNELLYSSNNAIYSYNVVTGAHKTVLTPSLYSNYSIFGFKYEGGLLIWEQFNSPYYESYTKANYQYSAQYGTQDGWRIENGNNYYYIGGIKQTGWLQLSDGTYYLGNDGAMRKAWQKVDGYWYFFGSDGIMKTGWVQSGSIWYYCKADGKMATGWCKVGSVWYFFNGDGIMQTGWLKQGGVWYYLQPSGAMATGIVKVGGVYYRFDSNGVWKSGTLSGWVSEGGKWYYISGNTMATGWKQVGGVWYYFNSAGQMLTGWQTIGGRQYYLKSSGAMAVGWCKISGEYYYFDANGYMKTGWVKDGGKWYYMTSGGTMATGYWEIGNSDYYFQNDGTMVTGWLRVGSYWYYFESSGAQAYGWKTIGGSTYFFRYDRSGAMATNCWIYNEDYYPTRWYFCGSDGVKVVSKWYRIDGIDYYFDSTGLCTNYYDYHYYNSYYYAPNYESNMVKASQ